MARMTPTSDGRGTFTLLPYEGRSYQAEVKHDGKTYTFDLPPVKDDGIGLSMDNTTSPDTATVTIRRRYDGNTPTIGMILSSRGCIYYSGEISLDSTAVLKINKSRVPAGVSTITLTDAGGHAVADRMFFADYSVMPEKNDHRRTLYWNPDVATGADGKARIEFYNNQTCRKMAVDAQGISAEGVIATSSVP